MRQQIITPQEADLEKIAGAIVYDGDGDGTSSAAIWLMDKPSGEYIAITNQQKNQRNLVQNLVNLNPRPNLRGLRVGIFDLAAEDNEEALENLVRSGSDLEFLDHHTKDRTKLPKIGFKDLTEQDTRDNCTSTIAYENWRKTYSREGNDQEEIKAAQLAIVGLANDAKSSAAERFREDIVPKEDREQLIKYAKAINFGSGKGSIDSVRLLRGFVSSNTPLQYLSKDPEVNRLVEERGYIIKNITTRSKILECNGAKLYVMPSENPEDRAMSTMAYNEFLNEEMRKDPNKVYAAALQTPEMNWRFSCRRIEGTPNALDIASRLASIYQTTAKGRNTAAGFDTKHDVIPTILKYLGETLNGK